MFHLGDGPLADKVLHDHFDIVVEHPFHVEVVHAEAPVRDMGLLLALGAYCGRAGPARERRPDKMPDDGRLPAFATGAELVGIPDLEYGSELEVERDERPGDIELPCRAELADIQPAASQRVVRVDVRVTGRCENLFPVSENQVEVVEEQVVLALVALFVDVAERLLVVIFFLLLFADDEQAGLLAPAEVGIGFLDGFGHGDSFVS